MFIGQKSGRIEDKMRDKDDETKEYLLEEKVNAGLLEEFDQSKCRKKKFGKEYYTCKEPEKAPVCAYAIRTPDGSVYCPRK